MKIARSSTLLKRLTCKEAIFSHSDQCKKMQNKKSAAVDMQNSHTSSIGLLEGVKREGRPHNHIS